MIIKNLLRRKFRTLMLVIGISVVLTSMQVILGVTNGFDSQVTSQLKREKVDVMAVQQNAVMSFTSSIPEKLATEISREPGVAGITPWILLLVNTQKFNMLIVYGVDPARLESHFAVTEGRLPQADDEVSVGTAIRKGLAPELGSIVNLYSKPLRVVGFHETGVESEDGAIAMTIQGARQLANKHGEYSIVGLELSPGTTADELISRLSNKYPELKFAKAADYLSTQQNIQLIKNMGQGVGVLSVVGGAIIIFIFSLIIVQERTKEIGMLRAVGWRRRRIITLVLGETMALSTMGALLSLVLSTGILFGMQQTPEVAAMLPVKFTVQTVLISFAVAIVLGFTGGLLSAWRASNLNPLEAFGRE